MSWVYPAAALAGWLCLSPLRDRGRADGRCSRSLLRCRACDRQVSLTAGTVLQDTRKPLRMWFLAMWFVTSQKNGVSALGLQRVLGLGSYETAWTWLHKLRRGDGPPLAAIASPARSRSTRLTSAARKRESADVRPRTRPLSLSRQRKVVVALAASACAVVADVFGGQSDPLRSGCRRARIDHLH